MILIATDRSQSTHTLQMVGSGLLLGTIGIFVINAEQDPATTVFFRCLFGSLSLGLWIAIKGKLSELKLSSKSLLAVFASGTLMASIWWLYFVSLNYISVGLSTLVYHLQPFWLVLLGSFLFKERITRSTIVFLLIAILGLALASGAFNKLEIVDGRGFIIGIGLCLFGSFLYAITTLIAKTNSDISPLAFAWWQCLVGAGVTSWSISNHASMSIGSAWIWLIGLGVIHTGIAFTLLYEGIRGLDTSRIAMLQFVYPGTALIVDWIYFNHSLTLTQWAGACLLGMALWSLKK